MDIYYEQNVANNYPNRHKKKKAFFSVIKWATLVAGLGMIFLAIIFPYEEGTEFTTMLIISGSIAFSGILLLLSWLFLRKLILDFNPEYDYVLNGINLTVIKVINKAKRKKLKTLNLERVRDFGKLDSESYEKLCMGRGFKRVYAIANPEDEEGLHYLLVEQDDERVLLEFEPSIEMMLSIKRNVPKNILIATDKKGYRF